MLGEEGTGSYDDDEDAQPLRMPTPSSEASTSGSDPDGDKYPPLPERGFFAHELFVKAALEEVGSYLQESE